MQGGLPQCTNNHGHCVALLRMRMGMLLWVAPGLQRAVRRQVISAAGTLEFENKSNLTFKQGGCT